MLRNRKYVLDLSDLQYKQVRISLEKKLLRACLWIAGSVLIAFLYGTVFEKMFGSPKERMLTQQLENMKLQYSLIGRQLDRSVETLGSLKLSDEIRYRTILDMDSVPESYRMGGYGGIDRFKDLTGYSNSGLIISFRSKIEEIKNRATVQTESFKTVSEKAVEWKREMDHMPVISPVSPEFRLGDKFGIRAIHPIYGTTRPHYGQDFEVPYGTEIHATGDGTIIDAGWNSGGFGNLIVIDHGYGLQSVYGHLSVIKVAKGLNVKRGDIIGLSGSTGSSTGPHLHYQIEKFGQHVNPVNSFNIDLNSEEYTKMIQASGSKSKFR